MPEREPFTNAIKRVTPPWLQRKIGGALMGALAEQADSLVDRTVDSVLLRMPGATAAIDPASLALAGRERRIRRGPNEIAATYARRLRSWWDDHRTRGGPYALLRQLFFFFVDSINPPIDVVYHSGTRRFVDTSGVITRDAITWGADGTSNWAQHWVFYHLPNTVERLNTLVTQAGDVLVTQSGDTLVAQEQVVPDALTTAELEVFLAVPREWSAAHIVLITIVLIWSTRRLWNYPQPVPTWSAWGASGALWADKPVVLGIAG